MKKVFISVISKEKPNYERIRQLIEEIPEKNLVVCYSNQYIEIAKELKKIFGERILSTIQVLGCSNPKFPEKTEGILFIGEGKFHVVSLAYESKLPTYILEQGKIKKISPQEIEKLEKKEKGMYMKYLNSEKVGVLISTKPGQQRLKKALEFSRNLKDKKAYLFMNNDLNISEFENFGIDCWINTACPRMDLNDISVINLDKLYKLQSSH
jgi:diphthamide biosynthesis enzyme Dph1/Dph2-like protein